MIRFSDVFLIYLNNSNPVLDRLKAWGVGLLLMLKKVWY